MSGIEDLFNDLAIFMEENFVVVIILLTLFFIGMIWLIRYSRQRKSANLRKLMSNWKNVRAFSHKVTKNAMLRICPLFGNEFAVTGEIFLVNSDLRRFKKEVAIEDERTLTPHQKNVLHDIRNMDSELKIEKISNEKVKGKGSHLKNLKIEKENLQKENVTVKSAETELVQQYDPGTILSEKDGQTVVSMIVEEKTDTYIWLDERNGRMAGLRASGLKPSQNILSMAGFMETARYDASRSKIPLYMILVIEAVLNTVLFVSMLSQKDPEFLFEPQMWGWYALTIAFLGFYMYLDKIIFGHYALMYSYNKTEEEFEFTSITGKQFSLLVDVYWIDTYYYPGFRINNVLNLNEQHLKDRKQDELMGMITKMTTMVQTAKSDIRFKDSLIVSKSSELDNMEERLNKERAIAYRHGREDEGSQVISPQYMQQQSSQSGELAKILGPLLIVVTVLGGLIFGLKYLADAINLDSIQTTLILIFGLCIGGFFLLIGLRGVLESSKRSTLG